MANGEHSVEIRTLKESVDTLWTNVNKMFQDGSMQCTMNRSEIEHLNREIFELKKTVERHHKENKSDHAFYTAAINDLRGADMLTKKDIEGFQKLPAKIDQSDENMRKSIRNYFLLFLTILAMAEAIKAFFGQ